MRGATSGSSGGAPWADRLLVLALMALHAGAYAWVTVVADTARDVGRGWRIAQGDAFPLLGPFIGGRWKLGPAWFYLLGGVLAVARSMTAVSLAVGVLGSLKIALGHALGRRLGGRACGLAWAALLALPGWGSVEQIVFTHINLVETTVLATFLAALAAWRRPSARAFLAVGLLWSLAVHAHPTAIVAAPAVAAAWWGAGAARARVAGALAGTAGALLPLAPMLVSEASRGFRQVGSTRGFVAGGGFGERLERAPEVVAGLLRNHVVVADFLLAPLGGLGRGIALATGALFALGIAAALVLPGVPRRRARWAAALWLALAAGFAATLRDPASPYFFYAVLPIGAGVAALGLGLAADRIGSPRARAALGGGLALFALVASVAFLRARSLAWRDGWQLLPNAALARVGATPDPGARPSDYLPVLALDELARALCASPGPLALHGDAGTLLHSAQGTPVWIACGRRDDLTIGGGGATLAGYPAGLWREAGARLPEGARGYVWFRSAETFETGEHRLRLSAQYPPYRWEKRPFADWTASAPVEADDWIAVTGLNPLVVRTRPPELSLDGAPVALAARSANTWLYRLPSAGTLALRVSSDDTSWLGVVRLRAEEALAAPAGPPLGEVVAR